MLFISWNLGHICLFEFIWVFKKFKKYLKGGSSYKSLGTSGLKSKMLSKIKIK
jgi:hypothetical protein